MLIGGLQKLTLIDYPGKIACTVFCVGCSFRCPFCYNPEFVLPEKIRGQPKIPEKDFLDFLRERKGFLEGVCIGGGEPTINEDLPDFCGRIKNLGYSIKLDTNGLDPIMLRKLIDEKLIDYVAMDVKAPKGKYLEVIGLEEQIGFKKMKSGFWKEKIIANIEKSINLLKQGKVDFEFRTTVVPALLLKSDILKIAKWISPAKKYFLQSFRPAKTINPKFEKVKPYPQKYLIEIQKAVAPFFEICQIRE